ncbi:NUDIX hydrolase [Streptomyces sp. NPDC088785]|uniref:NUDIX hydrolase n=1 Tax=Streptomyces sp. NPDC088785 TaxID=3365897 RepID=UPI003826D19C
MSGYPEHSVSAIAVIEDDDGRILAIRRNDNGRWVPPGGIVEYDESLVDAVRREAREETGLTVEPLRLGAVYKYRNPERGVVSLMFLCRVLSGTLTTNDEAGAFWWMTAAEVAANMSPTFAQRVFDTLEGPAVPVRSHDEHRVLAEVDLPGVEAGRPGGKVMS